MNREKKQERRKVSKIPTNPTIPTRRRRPTLSFAEQLALGEYRVPAGHGDFAGMTLDDVARQPTGLRWLRFISRGAFPHPFLDAIRDYLTTVHTAGPLDETGFETPMAPDRPQRERGDQGPSAAQVAPEGTSPAKEAGRTENAAHRATVGEKP